MWRNHLVKALISVLGRFAEFKERARDFYFEVLLSQYRCPKCGGRVRMTGQSECACACGNTFDPTVTFQKSPCCGTDLRRKTHHYACSRCNKTVPSRFLFDEQLFDKDYFREMMRNSRDRARKRKEAIRMLLAESRSAELSLMQTPDLDSIPGLVRDLDEFINGGLIEICTVPFDSASRFRMGDYRDHILSRLDWDNIHFSEIGPIIEDFRQDKIWRFVTLVFMENDREVELTQDGDDLWVQKTYNEAYT